MDTTKQTKKINKLAKKRDKLLMRVALGKKKIELKTEVKALKTDLRFLKHYNIKKGLEVIKSNLIQIRDGYTGLGFEPSLKSALNLTEVKKMDAQEIVDTPKEVALPEVKAQNPPQRQESIFGLPNMDLPMSDFSLDLPF